MKALSQEKLADVILEFAQQERSVLFTGAGVGKAVGYPLWHEYINHLAEVCEQHAAQTEAELIRTWVSKGRLIEASGIYEMTRDIPQGERIRHLAEPFTTVPSEEALRPLTHLFELPFEAVVTTNYDSSQHAAYVAAAHQFPRAIEREGTSMLAGADITAFYIARIHGSADTPRSMVLFPATYEALKHDEMYQDFLMSLFKSRPCLFVGFSFVDPAIDLVLETYKRKAQTIFKVPHGALLPAEPAATTLADRLSDLNIKAHYYDPVDGHKALWKAFRRASNEFAKKPVKPKPPVAKDNESSEAFRHFLSFTYAQVKLARDFQPLLQQAREGIILGIIQESGKEGATHEQIVSGLREALALDLQEALQIAGESTARLFREREIRVQNERHFLKKENPTVLERSLDALVAGVLDRLKVQFDLTPKAEEADLIREALEHVFMVRAWDLGAHYAGGGGGYGDDILTVIKERLSRQISSKDRNRVEPLSLSSLDLLRFPSNQETTHLSEISRAAFSLQLVLSSPRQSLFRAHVLPQRVYFDASILLPAIVPGHPFHKLYRETIDRLLNAARQVGVDCRLCVGAPFLNEVVSHRQRAIELANAMKVDDVKEFKKVVLAFGAENLNVFLGGFSGVSSARERAKEKRISFRQFLAESAPYASEEALNRYLRREGFEIVLMDFRNEHNSEYVALFNSLLTGYEKHRDDDIRGKERLLVEHEAVQLVQMSVDLAAGLRSVFVSNDRKLRRAAETERATKKLASDILPPQGFIGLVDIVVGSRPDPRGLARLLWASSRRETDQILRDYLVKRALLEQDVAMAKASAEVIDGIITEAKAEAKTKSLDLSDNRTAEAATEAIDFVDRFEDRFFEKMRRAIERQER
jgi:predicted nucleic acid-binding protein